MTEQNQTATDDDFDLGLLDKNISDIEDLPSFEVPPKGTYAMLVSGGTKKINEHPAVFFDLEVVSTLQLVDAGATPVKDGTKTGVMFLIDNEFGEGSLKKFLAPFAAHFNEENVRRLVKELIQNVAITCTMDHQTDKTDKTKIYARPKNIAVA
jgi:hypothetical protein